MDEIDPSAKKCIIHCRRKDQRSNKTDGITRQKLKTSRTYCYLVMKSQPQYYTAIIQHPDPDRLPKLLELGDPDLFGCYTPNRRESNTVRVNSDAEVTEHFLKLSIL